MSNTQFWDDSYQLKVCTLEWKIVSNLQFLPKEPMVYQIYGDSPIYGNNQLLYIGLTNGKDKRPYIHEEGKGINNFSVRYASCPEDELKTVEAILIVTHKPSHNEKGIANSSLLETDELRLVYNEGERGSLNLEVSNMYWCKDPQ